MTFRSPKGVVIFHYEIQYSILRIASSFILVILFLLSSKTAVGCISFCSSHSFIANLKKYLVRELDFSKNKVEDTGNAAVVRWSGKEGIERFFHFIYDDATVYLPRKKEKMEKLLTLS